MLFMLLSVFHLDDVTSCSIINGWWLVQSAIHSCGSVPCRTGLFPLKPVYSQCIASVAPVQSFWVQCVSVWPQIRFTFSIRRGHNVFITVKLWNRIRSSDSDHRSTWIRNKTGLVKAKVVSPSGAAGGGWRYCRIRLHLQWNQVSPLINIRSGLYHSPQEGGWGLGKIFTISLLTVAKPESEDEH